MSIDNRSDRSHSYVSEFEGSMTFNPSRSGDTARADIMQEWVRQGITAISFAAPTRRLGYRSSQ
jgi:hypothetical protein